ncbi:MAG: hypothetical protein AWM53_01997 [Candidatus Dichloromethanomonas elyunquensis]|nr:MAG: hypothetical protein AWM53_01997 [Candidatus Dichloromethanomonas elyunquensis]
MILSKEKIQNEINELKTWRELNKENYVYKVIESKDLIDTIESQQQEIKQKDEALEQAREVFNNILSGDGDLNDAIEEAITGINLIEKALGGDDVQQG